MEKFHLIKESTKRVRQFNMVGRSVEFKVNPIPQDTEPVTWVKDAVSGIIKKATAHLQPEDKVGITFCSKEFERGQGYMKFREASKVNIDDVWAIINGVFQSNSTGLNTDTFCLNVTSVRMPKGRGRGQNYNNFNEECAQRKGIVSINNGDNMCLPRALVVAIAHASKDPKYKEVRQDIRREQTTRATALADAARVKVPEEGCGIEEVQLFQNHLKNYKIVVYSYGNKGRDVIFSGPDASQKLNLLYHKGHFNVITSLTSAFCCVYYCEECHVPFYHKNEHRCGGTCSACQQAPKCDFVEKVTCTECQRSFRSRECFLKHKEPNSYEKNKTICDNFRRCPDCCKTVKARKDKHVCGEIYCKICKGHKPADHLCYMQPDTRSPKLKDFLFVFYDIESRQDTKLDNGDLLHEPNLCVFKTCCAACINSQDKTCNLCGGERLRISMNEEEYNWLNHTPIEWFMNQLMGLRKKFKKIIVIAHNGQAYDHQFVLNYVLNKTDLTPELIMRGTKIIKMTIANVSFIDSLNFFPMALSALPKAFGLGDGFKKGYFPHLFNRLENQSYVGPFPDSEFYSPDTMKVCDDCDEKCKKAGCRNNFVMWYSNNKDNVFDFRKEIIEYCVSDVEILTAACLKFRELLLSVGKVCPLTEACTIASACNKVYRRNFLKPNTIGIIPRGGYRWRDIQSKIAVQWLVWEEHQRQITIRSAATGSEVIIAGVKVDGFCEDTKQVYEFHGCYYHGCPRCFRFKRDEPLEDDPTATMNLRHESTLAKTERLRDKGYEVIEMWQCEFLQEMSLKPEIREFSGAHPLLNNVPLNPRDAFYGGRTGNCVEYYEAAPGEKIKYVDVCSLYPWVCKYGKFPVGHPEVIVGHDKCAKLDLAGTDGLIKCSVLPPQDLFHPVLPLKMNNKLMFVLCRECGLEMDQSASCDHTDEQRALHGTWVIDEVLKALEKGYRLLEIQEIWKYECVRYDPESRLGGLFTEMMDLFIRYKQQASGWPSECDTQERKDSYIAAFLEQEGISLKFDEILSNPGLRSLAKLMLNSFWGKLGQRENQPKTSIVNKPEDLFDLLANPAVAVCGILPVNETTVIVNYEHLEEAYDPLSTVNVTLAAYTTTQARLKLYSYLEQLGERALYYDTDSVIYISRDGEWDVPIGSMLGEMTDELEPKYGPGSYITKFASGGPKNYGYEVLCVKGAFMTCKIKGITLNYQSSWLGFRKIADMILKRSEPVPIVSTNIRRTTDHLIVTKQETKMYRPNSTKRVFTDYFSVPYGFKRQKLE